MASFGPEFIDQLRGRIVLSELVSRDVRLTRRGREMLGLCPFHPEKTPSFSVNDEKGFYHCFGCGAHGDVFSFLENTQNLNFSESVVRLAEQVGLPLPQISEKTLALQKVALSLHTVLEKACVWFEAQLFSSRGEKARDYLVRRGVSLNIQKQFRLGWSPSQSIELREALIKQGFSLESLIEAGLVTQPEPSEAPYDRFRQRVIFPVFDDRGRVIAFGGRLLGEGLPKYLNSPETPLFSKGHNLYGWWQSRTHDVLKKKPVVIVEGYMDAIAFHKEGLAQALAPLGTALTEEQILKAWRLTPEPFVCFDGDSAGQKAALRAAQRVLPLLKAGFSLKFVRLPLGEDPDSLIASGGASKMQSLLDQAQPLVDFLWQDLLKNPPRTPEQKALFQDNIKKLSLQIKDFSIRSLYEQVFKERWRDFLKRERLNQNPFVLKKKGLASITSHFEEMPTASRVSFDALMIQRKILLAVLINHPNLLSEVNESVATLVLLRGDFDQLREDLLCWEAEKESFDVDQNSLEDYLIQRGHQETLNQILTDDVYAHASFARKEALLESARAGWLEVWQFHQSRSLMAEELQQIQISFERDLSETSWVRLQQLREFYI